jgi:3-hydroxybutyryl-CoA dehydrogenase
MKIAVITNSLLRAELETVSSPASGVYWHTEPSGIQDSDVVIDLLYDGSEGRLQLLAQFNSPLVMVNDVTGNSALFPGIVRFNGWPTLLKGNRVEASGPAALREKTEKAMALFGKQTTWVPDQPGFVTPRVISMIINEAYLALGEEVSSREDIDTAMKLGTNYPYGPFEWTRIIGADRIVRLLRILEAADTKYAPAPLLVKEATQP